MMGCPSNCTYHGDCIDGNCFCYDGWAGDTCAESTFGATYKGPYAGPITGGTEVSFITNGWLTAGVLYEQISCLFDGVPAKVNYNPKSHGLSCIAPPVKEAKTIQVLLRIQAMTGSNAPPWTSGNRQPFTYFINPQVELYEPAALPGPIGGMVTVVGRGFAGNILSKSDFKCRFSYSGRVTESTGTWLSDFRVRCPVPAKDDLQTKATATIEISPNGIDYTNSKAELYYFDTSTVAPSCIVAGGSLTVTIQGFNLDKVPTGYCKLNNDSNLVFASEYAAGQGHICTVVSPASDKSGKAKSLMFSADGINYIGGPQSSPVSLNMIEPPSITSFIPEVGSMKGGQIVTVFGKGFDSCGKADVGCKFDTAESPSATLDTATGSIRCTLPKSPAGASLVPVAISLNKVAYVSAPNLFYYHDTPTVISLTPDRGPLSGTTMVTVLGTNFYNSDTLRCVFRTGTTQATVPKLYISSEKIVCETPTSTATGKIVISVSLNGQTTGDSVSTEQSEFEYYAQPILQSIEPKFAPLKGGVQVTIKGQSFPDPANPPKGLQCKFKDTVSPDTPKLGNGEIVCTAPPMPIAESAFITVTLNGQDYGRDTPQAQLRYYDVSSFSPVGGPSSGGTNVTIQIANGANILAADVDAQCTFSGSEVVPATYALTGSITCTAPATTAASPGPASLTISLDKKSSVTTTEPYVYYAPVSTDSYTPMYAQSNSATKITISGSGFVVMKGSSCSFTGADDGVPQILPATFESSTRMSCLTPNYGIVPSAGRSAQVQFALNGFDYQTVGQNMTFFNPPSVSSIAPQFVPNTGGSVITLTGSGFINSGSVTVRFTVSPTEEYDVQSVVSLTDTEIQVKTPAIADLHNKQVTVSMSFNGDQFSNSAQGVTYYRTPTLFSVSPTAGYSSAPFTVTVYGKNFVNTPTLGCRFGKVVGTGTFFVSSNQFTCIVPQQTLSDDSSASSDVEVTVDGLNYFYAASGTGQMTLSASGRRRLLQTGNSHVTMNLYGVQTQSCPGACSGHGTCGATLQCTCSSFYGGLDCSEEPAITAMSTQSGPSSGGTPIVITINNKYLTNAPATTFQVIFKLSNGQSISVASALNVDQLSLSAPANTGQASVQLSANGAALNSVATWLYYAVPSLASTTPIGGVISGGTAVTIDGQNFVSTGELACRFGTQQSSRVRIVSATQVVCDTPTSPGGATGAVDVALALNGNEFVSLAAAFLYYTEPTLTSIAPNWGPISGGTVITITGKGFISGFDATLQCCWGGCGKGEVAVATYLNTTEVTCISPTGLVLQDNQMKLSLNGQSYTTTTTFNVYENPSFSTVTPNLSPIIGTSPNLVTVVGKNFKDTKIIKVRVGTVEATAKFIDANMISLEAPAQTSASQQPVSVALNGQQFVDGNNAAIDYYNLPLITAVSPGVGPLEGGTLVTLTGTNFVNDPELECYFGPSADKAVKATELIFVSDKQIQCRTPGFEVASSQMVRVRFRGYEHPDLDQKQVFNFYDSTQLFINLTPNSGPISGETAVVLTVEFKDQPMIDLSLLPAALVKAQVEVDGNTLDTVATVSSATTVTMKMPGSGKPGLGKVKLSLNGGLDYTQNPTVFAYYQTPTIVRLTPNLSGLAAQTKVEVTLSDFKTGVGATESSWRSILKAAACRFGIRTSTASSIISSANYTSKFNFECFAPQYALPGTFSVEFALNGQQYSSLGGQTFLYHAPITIANVQPNIGIQSGGTPLQITGSNFIEGNKEHAKCRFTATAPIQGVFVSDAKISNTGLVTCVTPEISPKTAAPVPTALAVSMNGQQYSVQTLTFTFFPQPQISELQPDFAPTSGNTVVSILGEIFVESKQVTPLCYFDSVSSTSSFESVVTFKSSGLVTCATPSNMPPGEYRLSVSMNREPLEKSTARPFYVVNTQVTKINPLSAPNLGPANYTMASGAEIGLPPFFGTPMNMSGSSIITVTGKGFSFVDKTKNIVPKNLQCVLKTETLTERIPATFVRAEALDGSSDAMMTCTIQQTLISQMVSLEASVDGQLSSSSQQQFLLYPQPAVSGLMPALGPSVGGTTLTVQGRDFTNQPANFVMPTCRFNNKVVTIAQWQSPFAMTCKAPAVTDMGMILYKDKADNSSYVWVEVSLNGQQYTDNRVKYVYYEPPQVKSVSPNSGPATGQNLVNVMGLNFLDSNRAQQNALRCKFGAIDVPATFKANNLVQCNTPTYSVNAAAGPTTVPVEVTLNGESYTSNQVSYTYYIQPVITGINPTSGPNNGNFSITFTGQNFFSSSLLRCKFGDLITDSVIFVKSIGVICAAPILPLGQEVQASLTFNGQDYTTERMMFTFLADPPELTMRLSGSVAQIMGSFDVPVSIRDQIVCSRLFSAATLNLLGRGAQCTLNTESTMLTISLGQGATVLLDSDITFKAGLLIERKNEKSSALDVSVGYRVNTPLDPPPVMARISGPNQVGRCENSFSLSAVSSYGDAARSWKSVAWDLDLSSSSVSGTTQEVGAQVLKDIQASLRLKTDLSITVKSETQDIDVLPEGSYAVRLTLTNWLGQTGTTTTVVKKVADAIPLVVLSGNQFAISRAETLSIDLQTTIPTNCNGASAGAVSFQWTIEPKAAAPTEGLNLQSSTLAFPAYYFVNGVEYTITGTASQNGGQLTSSATATVKVTDAAPVAILASAEQEQPLNTDLFLDGSESHDPDIAPANRKPADLLWSWSCQGKSTVNGSSQVLTTFCPTNLYNGAALPKFSLTNRITIDTQRLTPGNEYYFTLTVYKCRKNNVNLCGSDNNDKYQTLASASVETKVTITESKKPVVTIQTSSQKFSKEDPVQLVARAVSVDGTKMASYKWSLSPTGLSSSIIDSKMNGVLTDAQNLVDEQYFTELPLVIKANKLDAGATYTASITVTDEKGRTSEAKSSFTINVPPMNGLFNVDLLLPNGQVAPSNAGGVALQDTYRLSASRWTDDPSDMPLKYAFYTAQVYTDSTDQSTWSILAPESESPIFEGQLPSGNAQRQLTIICAVLDTYGDAAYVTSVVTIQPPGQTGNALAAKLTAETDALTIVAIRTGNYEAALNRLSTLTSELQTLTLGRRRRQSTEECSARTALVNTVKQLCTNLPVNIVPEYNRVCAANLEKTCYDLVGCDSPAPACTEVLTKLTETVSGISPKGVPALETTADSILGSAASADTKTQVVRYSAVQKALQQSANAKLSKAVFDQTPMATTKTQFSLTAQKKRMSVVTTGFVLSASRTTEAEIPKDILATGNTASVCDALGNCKTQTIAKSEVNAVLLNYANTINPHAAENKETLRSSVLDLTLFASSTSQRIAVSGLKNKIKLRIPVVTPLTTEQTQLDKETGSRNVLTCATWSTATQAWDLIDNSARENWCTAQGRSDKEAPTVPAKACPEMKAGDVLTCQTSHTSEFSIVVASAGCNGVVGSKARYDLCGDCDNNSDRCRDCENIPNGGKQLDYCGNCGGTNSTCVDCRGVPNGPARYDVCGVCDGNNECVGCDGIPNSGSVIDKCGVCKGLDDTCKGCDGITNSGKEFDRCGSCLIKWVYSSTGSRSEAPSWNNCLDCNGVPNGGATEDKCDVCGGNDACIDCEGIKNGPKRLDACNVCGGYDECVGCDNQPNSGLVMDKCGICGGGNECVDCKGVPHGGARYDLCGVCDGDGTSCIDCRGVKDGPAKSDRCNVCQGNDECVGCDNVAFSGKKEDKCGVCGGTDACVDCFGVPNGGNKFDRCNVCAGNDECVDCKGVPFGTSKVDVCRVCGGDGLSCLGCDGVPFSGAIIDPNGVCGGAGWCDGIANSAKEYDQCGVCGGNDACLDCFGVPFGTSRRDQCNVCDGYDTCLGCDNVPFSGKTYDICGECGGADSCVDCYGVLYGPAKTDRCNVCEGTDACLGCDNVPFSGLVYDQCGACGGRDSCVDCTGVPYGFTRLDECGVCGGNGRLDLCGVCQGRNACVGCDGIPRPGNPTQVDKCGQCGGVDACIGCDGLAGFPPLVTDQCGVCGGRNECVDCAGVPYGTSRFDACGTCGGNGECCPNGQPRDRCGVCGGAGLCVGCDGVPNSGKVVDACGICGGDGQTCIGCDGRPGRAENDKCGQCGGNDACVDCAGIPFGLSTVDACGVCGGNGQSCIGCDGVAFSGKVIDKCGECGGADACVDCAGVPHGTSQMLVCGCNDARSCIGCDGVPNSGKTYDLCGVCGGTNDCLDCAGVPHGDAKELVCGCNDARSCLDCNDVPYGPAIVDLSGVCGGTDWCDGVANSGRTVDLCGVCGKVGDANYVKDGCVDCAGVPHGTSVADACGECGGSGVLDKCGICNGNNDCVDCAGTAYGTAQLDRCGVCQGDGTSCATFSPLEVGETRSPTTAQVRNAEKVRIRMCVNSAFPATDAEQTQAKQTIRDEVARAAGVSRSQISIDDMTITQGCNTRRRQDTEGYSVAFDLIDSGDYAAERPINSFRKLQTQSNDAASTLRTGSLTQYVVPGSLQLVCMTGCDGRQICAEDVGGTIDTSNVLIVDPYGMCGGSGWCDGIPNSGNVDCPEFTPVPTYTPLAPSETRGPTTRPPRDAPATNGPSLAPLETGTRAPALTPESAAPTADPATPTTRPVTPPAPVPGSPAGTTVASWFTVGIALLACMLTGY
jgi:hypothetical protein